MSLAKLFVLLWILTSTYCVTAQEDVNKMIPPSPNTASLGEYGKVPTNLNTGVPSISVPLYQIKGNDLELPIGLSYHGDGIKVEEMATWVGLGWSLNAGGVITRAIRSNPDETAVGEGYFQNEYTSDLLEEGGTITDEEKEILILAAKGMVDLEPDMFYFNFAGRSGKFVYNKEQDKFETIPSSTMKISFHGTTGWEIVTEDGTTYTFSETESNDTGSFCNGQESSSNSVASGWYLTEISGAKGIESIYLQYELEIYSYNTLGLEKKYIVFNPAQDCSFLNGQYPDHVCVVQNSYITPRLTRIIHRAGRVEFVKAASQRSDLPGTYALDTIAVYNNSNEIVVSYKLNQTYFSGGNKLKLNSIEKVISGQKELYRKFDYMTSSVPDRFSKGQDYWGFNNGAANTTLVPSLIVDIAGGSVARPTYFAGAHRRASTQANLSQAGMLKRITYPTGGYTEFEFENHHVKNSFDPEYIIKHEFFSAVGGTAPIYQKTFSIEEPPSALNGHNPDGGAMISILIDGINCSYGPVATTDCAIISINSSYMGTITGSFSNRFLPNGTYTITADFSGNPDHPSYEEFFIDISYKQLAPHALKNSAIGGLRVKRIMDYDPITNKAAYTRTYKYTLEEDTTTSSAEIQTPEFLRIVSYKAQCSISSSGSDLRTCDRYEYTAYSNFPTIGLGLPVSYTFVTVLEDSLGLKGKTTSKFTDYPDIVNNYFPFSPVLSYDWRSGQLLQQKEFLRSGSTYVLLKETTKTFQLLNNHEIYGIKAGQAIVCMDNAYTVDQFDMGYYATDRYAIPNGYFYDNATTTKTFLPQTSDYILESESSVLSPSHFNVVKKEVTNSKGDKIIEKFKYTDDYTGSGTDIASQAIQWQKEKNITNLIEKSSWLVTVPGDTLFLGGTLYAYKFGHGLYTVPASLSSIANSKTGHFLESSIIDGIFKADPQYSVDVEYLSYDHAANLTSVREKNGNNTSFIWNAPATEMIGSVIGSVADVFHTSFEDDGDLDANAFTGRKVFSCGVYTLPPNFIPTSAGSLVMTYWYWQDSKWNFSGEVVFNATIESTGEKLDEIRVYPRNAQMTTYTHRVGVGITSVMDSNNRRTLYDYDPFGRLKTIRDHNGGLIRINQYHYKTPE